LLVIDIVVFKNVISASVLFCMYFLKTSRGARRLHRGTTAARSEHQVSTKLTNELYQRNSELLSVYIRR